MIIKTKKIIKFSEEYLNTKNFQDYCHNGLQVEGAPEISKIITGVSFSQKLIEEAIKRKAQMIIVHHGIFKNNIPELPEIKGILKNRLKLLLENNINLVGFHLPLDAHPIIGNNISLINLLNLKKLKTLNSPQYGDIGFIGEYGQALDFKDFVDLVNKKLNTDSYYIPAGPKKVKKVGIISGGASPDFVFAAEQGVDTYICGDAREEIVRAVEETKINFINAGHYNTERLGVMNLGKLIQKKFKIAVEFVEVPNDI
jgi:dinuclear metal center YbgI/SA1388 family protein